jgi:hypothetical protein
VFFLLIGVLSVYNLCSTKAEQAENPKKSRRIHKQIMKILVTTPLVVIALALSSCYTVKLNYPPDDTIPIFSESPLIQYSISKKKMSYRLGFMKNKGQRFRLLRKIQSLNHTAESRFKAKTLATDKYTGLCTISCISVQLVTWFAIIESSQGRKIGKSMKQDELQSIQTLSTQYPKMNQLLAKSNLETEDGIVEFLKQIIVLMEEVLSES